MNKIILVFICFLSITGLQAQTLPNDDCAGAIFLPNVKSFCSKYNDPVFTTVGATPSGFGPATCISNVGNDVWFSFVPLFPDINIVIKGVGNPAGTGGSLKFPEAALYSGDCNGTLTEWECQKDNSGIGIINLYQGGLIIGQTYFIRIQSKPGGGTKDGTFQICMENFNPPKIPQGDCPKASVLCDKSPFVVQSVSGFGLDGNEISAADADCFSNGLGGVQNVEMSSTWYKWTCDKSGPLTFTLTPLKDDDDIDFILFELPGGIDDCKGKKAVRCMASGDSKYPSPCMGPTGLKDGESDLSESAGCGSGKNSFIKPLDMEAGKSYALMVNNFTSTKTGFKMEFGGTGTFLGPEAKFSTTSTAKVCYGESLTFQDESFFSNGVIKKWQWNFGQGANPSQLTDTSKPPLHTVTYNSPGTKYVSLTIETDRGCIVTADIKPFNIDSCCQTKNKIIISPVVTDLKCPDLLEGAINLNPNVIIPTTYSWDIGKTSTNISDLGAGIYKVTISNAATCDTVFSFNVKSPQPLATDTLLKKPTCNGGQDGIITLLPNGGKSPYQYDFGSGYSTNNTLSNLAVGKYPAFIKDANGCLKALTIDLKELELNLDPTVKAAIPPSCFGFSNGSITLNISNGKQPFLFDFGSGFQNSSSISNLKAGTYNVTVQDDNLCKGVFKFDLNEPDKIVLTTDSTVITCYGANDGRAIVVGKGGTGAYKYLWSDNKTQTDAEAIGLSPGLYTVSVTDENNCIETANVQLSQPPQLGVKPLNLKDLLCYNDRTGEVQFIGQGGRPPYRYSLDGVVFQKSDIFKNLAAGTYSLIVKDTAECEFQIPVTLLEPNPFLVNAGSDQTIELGESTNLLAETSPIGKNVSVWTWTPDSTLTCKDCPNPIATPFNTTTYTILAVDDTGCKAQDRVTIVVTKSRRTFPPNIFSPGDDNGINDRFTIFSDRSVKKIQVLSIYDRWGDLVFEGKDFPTNDNKFGWDGTFRGKKAAEGIYTWVALIEFIDSEVITYKGDIMLIR